MGSRKLICRMYEAFGECKYGINCARSHDEWPYRTRSAVATIVTEGIELPRVVAFRIQSDGDDGASRTEQYYISKGRWFSADAATGDVVEILISDKMHPGSGCCCARISNILEYASTSRITPIMPVRFRQKHDCVDFLTYRDCKWGARCTHTHDVTAAYDQCFHVAEILSVISFRGQEIDVEVEAIQSSHTHQFENRRYFIPGRFSGNVAKGNLVIVQESSRMHESGMHFGKIVTILHESQGVRKSEVPLEMFVKYAFTLPEPPRLYDSLQRHMSRAYSVENCSRHSNCQRIGVHFRAAALGVHFMKLDRFFLPLHKVSPRDQAKGFDADSIRFALTMYAHSKSGDIEGPILTPVLVRSECMYTLNDARKYQGYLKHLWPVFGAKSFINSIVNSVAASYLVDFPETWREQFLVHRMISFFNNKISNYLQSKDDKLVIVRNVSSGNSAPIAAKDVVIPAKNLEMVESAWQVSTSPVEQKEIALGILLGSVKRSAQEFWEEQMYDRYKCEVVSCDRLRDNQSVIVTSPIAQTVDFLNQQVVLSLMISPEKPVLYSKNELLGILARRYDTPEILKAVVRDLTKTHVYLHFRGIFSRRRGNRLVRLDQIFKCPTVLGLSRSDDAVAQVSNDESVDTISLLLENLTSDEYCNSRLVRLSGDQIAALAVTTIQQGIEATETASDIRSLISTREEYDAPYQLDEKGTLVTLSCGVELQLQVAFREEVLEDENNHWLRLLRVGNDCHLCLVHLNSPKWAYFSGRLDVTGLITESSLEQMKERIASNSLKTVTLRDIAIEWDNNYFSGGTFNSTMSMKLRNLLCIRKEVMGAEHSMFVWTCHGVVSDVGHNQVKFMVCSLYQDLTAKVWNQIENGNFIIEVIDIEEENVPNL